MLPDAVPLDLPISPPGHALYTAGDESLVCSVMNALAGVRVRIAGRFMHLDGRVEPIVDSFVPASDRSVSVKRVALARGWLLEAQASVSAGTPQTGQTFAVLSIVRGRTGAFEELATLAAGPISAVHRLAWPGSPITSSVEGAGALRYITGSTPAPGGEISETVPTGARWQLLSLRTLLTTSATVANRQPFLEPDDGTVITGSYPQNSTTVASSSRIYTWNSGVPLLVAALGTRGVQGLPMPLLLLPGHRIRTSTVALDATDQYSAVIYAVREWIEGA